MDLIAGVASWWKGSHYLPGNNGAGHSGLGADLEFLHEMDGIVKSYGPQTQTTGEVQSSQMPSNATSELGAPCPEDENVLIGRVLKHVHLMHSTSAQNVRERDLPPDWRQRQQPFCAADDFLGNLDVLNLQSLPEGVNKKAKLKKTKSIDGTENESMESDGSSKENITTDVAKIDDTNLKEEETAGDSNKGDDRPPDEAEEPMAEGTNCTDLIEFHISSVILMDTQSPYLRERCGDLYLTRFHLVHRPCLIESVCIEDDSEECVEEKRPALSAKPSQWVRLPLTSVDRINVLYERIEVVCKEIGSPMNGTERLQADEGLYSTTVPVLQVYLKDFRHFKFGLGIGEANPDQFYLTSGYSMEMIDDDISVVKLPVETVSLFRERMKMFESLCTTLEDTLQNGASPFAFQFREELALMGGKKDDIHFLMENMEPNIWNPLIEYKRLGVDTAIELESCDKAKSETECKDGSDDQQSLALEIEREEERREEKEKEKGENTKLDVNDKSTVESGRTTSDQSTVKHDGWWEWLRGKRGNANQTSAEQLDYLHSNENDMTPNEDIQGTTTATKCYAIPDNHTVITWRISQFNSSYQFCETYPSLLPVPSNVSDEILIKCSRFRAKGRVPALSWRHQKNGAVLMRSSQPLPGVLGYRSVEDEQVVAASLRSCGKFPPGSGSHFIIDARPQFNAMANAVVSGGYENTILYPDCRLLFVDVANIHSVRDSYTKLKAACLRPSDDPTWLKTIDSSNWLHNLLSVLRGALLIARIMDIGQRSVLVHCTDGWDRTAQLVSLSQLIMDPHYRTLEGFRSLIEKDFLWFGHRFPDRTGISLLSNSMEDISAAVSQNTAMASNRTISEQPMEKKHGGSNEQSPVFIQWLDCVRQIMSQNPTTFEFSPLLLVALTDLLHCGSCGTFLCNNDKERKIEGIEYQTLSVWDYIEARRHLFINPNYQRDENALVVVATARKLVLWEEFYLRWDVNFWCKRYHLEMIPIGFLADLSRHTMQYLDNYSGLLNEKAIFY